MNYKQYPDKKGTPNRRARKSERNSVFRHNSALRSKANKAKRVARAELNNA